MSGGGVTGRREVIRQEAGSASAASPILSARPCVFDIEGIVKTGGSRVVTVWQKFLIQV